MADNIEHDKVSNLPPPECYYMESHHLKGYDNAVLCPPDLLIVIVTDVLAGK